MYVIADMEWITVKGISSPTQLAAVKVDEDWNEIDSFNTLIRPRDGTFHDWKHMAYSAGTPTEYLYARNVFSVLGAFVNWLDQDDVILWWHSDSQKLFKKLERCVLKRSNSRSAKCLNEYVHAFLGDESKTVGGPYHLASSFGVPVDMSRTHCSDNDVYVLRKLLQAIEFPQKNLELPLVKQECPITLKSMDAELPYQYDVKMNRVHQRDCELIHYVQTKGVQNLKSSVQHMVISLANAAPVSLERLCVNEIARRWIVSTIHTHIHPIPKFFISTAAKPC